MHHKALLLPNCPLVIGQKKREKSVALNVHSSFPSFSIPHSTKVLTFCEPPEDESVYSLAHRRTEGASVSRRETEDLVPLWPICRYQDYSFKREGCICMERGCTPKGTQIEKKMKKG